MTSFDDQLNRTGTGSLKWDRYLAGDILPLWVADMDFRAAEVIVEALRRRCDHGVFGYTVPYAEVEEAVLEYQWTRHGIRAERDWIVWMPGVVPALNLVCLAYAGTGEGVLTATPVYPPFLTAPVNQGRVLQAVPLVRVDEAWGFDWPAMDRAVTSRTRVFILCNPHNPVGQVFSREELTRVVDFCVKHDLVLCSDEIHCDLVLDDVAHVSTLSLGDQAVERALALHAPSKTYNLPGLACAYALIPHAPLRARLRRVNRGIITEINAFGYAGCAAAYREGEPWRQELIAYLRANRDALYAFVAEKIPELRMHPMQATYLAWIDARGLPVDNPHRFFEEHGIGLSDGADFGAPGFVRLNFGCPRAVLEQGLERMETAVRELR